jgi:hypothetical protein
MLPIIGLMAWCAAEFLGSGALDEMPTDCDRRKVMAAGDQAAGGSKPTLAQLGVDPADLDWERSGSGAGSLEVAFIGADAGRVEAGRAEAGRTGERIGAGALWVLLRVAGDPAGRVLVYDRTEWTCFLDGARQGEFG